MVSQELRRFQKISAEHLNFRPAASRQQRRAMHVTIDPQTVARRAFIRVQRHRIRHRVADKPAGNVEFVIKRFFRKAEMPVPDRWICQF